MVDRGDQGGFGRGTQAQKLVDGIKDFADGLSNPTQGNEGNAVCQQGNVYGHERDKDGRLWQGALRQEGNVYRHERDKDARLWQGALRQEGNVELEYAGKQTHIALLTEGVLSTSGLDSTGEISGTVH